MKSVKRYGWIPAATVFALGMGCGSPSYFDAFVGTYGDVRATVEVTSEGSAPFAPLSDATLISPMQLVIVVESDDHGYHWDEVRVYLSDRRLDCTLRTSGLSSGTTLTFGREGGQCGLEGGARLKLTDGQAALSADGSELRFRLEGTYEADGESRSFTATITGHRTQRR